MPSTLETGAAAVTTGSGSATTLSFTVPSGTQTGDYICIWCAGNSSTRTFSATGYTEVDTGNTGAAVNGSLLYKVASAGDLGGSVTVTESGSASAWAGVIFSVSAPGGWDPSAPTSGGQANTASTTITVPGLTTTTSGDLLVWVGAVRAGAAGGTAGTITPPTGFTTAVAEAKSSSTSLANIGVLLATTTQATAGATGSENGTSSVSQANAGLLLAFAGSSGTPVSAADTATGTDTAVVGVTATDTATGADQATLWNSFEGGTDGTAISVANSGGSSGAAWDSLGGSTTLPVYSAAGAIHGSLGASTPLSANSTTTLEWKAQFAAGFNASSVPWYTRDYFKITSLPPVQVFLMKAQDDNVPQDVWAVYLDTTGHLGLRNRLAGTNIATSTGTVALNTPTRCEAQCIYDGATYSLTLRCFFGANAEGVTPDETLTASVGSASAYPVNIISFGAQTATVTTWSTVYHDDIAVSSAGWIGPVTATGPAPGTDTTTGTDTATVTVAAADTATGADTAAVGVAGGDTAAAADTAAAIGVIGADTATGTDIATAAATISAADTGGGSDSAQLAVAAADTATGAETAIPGPTATDTATGTDVATVAAAITATDTATGADTGSLPAAGGNRAAFLLFFP